MTGRGSAGWALTVGGTAVALLVVGTVLGVRSAPTTFEQADQLLNLAWLGFPVIGAMIALRRPGVGLARLLLASGIAMGLGAVGAALAARSYTWGAGTAVEGSVGLALDVFWPTGAMLVAAALLRFPGDRLPTRLLRWHHGVLLAAAAIHTLRLFEPVLEHGPADAVIVVPNPLSVPYLSGLAGAARIATVVGLLGFFAAIIHVGARGLRSRGVERQQMKWLAYATVVYLLLMGAIGVGHVIGAGSEETGEYVAIVTMVVCFNGMAAAVGLAVLRHRLFEIDRLVTRTASYAVLTALLAAIYAAGVLGLGRAIPVLSGGPGGDLLVAASTLAAAAAFGPLRRRVQLLVDRRFDRARYDAARTVERFSARLRDEVDLEVLRGEIARTAGASLSPTHAGVWLPPATSRT